MIDLIIKAMNLTPHFQVTWLEKTEPLLSPEDLTELSEYGILITQRKDSDGYPAMVSYLFKKEDN